MCLYVSLRAAGRRREAPSSSLGSIRDSPRQEFRVWYRSAVAVSVFSRQPEQHRAAVTTGRHAERALGSRGSREAKSRISSRRFQTTTRRKSAARFCGGRTASSRTQTHMKEELHIKWVIMVGREKTVFARLSTATHKNLTISASALHKNLPPRCIFSCLLVFWSEGRENTKKCIGPDVLCKYSKVEKI